MSLSKTISKERFLVTGAAGFVGANMVRRLLKMGLKVHAVVSTSGDLWRIKDVLPQITLHRGDITDETFVRKVMEKVRPDIIYHLAAHGAYPTQKDPKRILLTNVLGTLNLLEALDKIPYKLFVNTGSSSEYGFKEVPMQEDDFLEPNSYYAVAKAAQSLLAQYTARSKKKPIVTFRLFSVYGPYEEPSRLVPTIIRRCLHGETLTMASPQTARDFIFVEDLLDAYLNIEALQTCGGQIINLGTGRQTTLKQITKIVLGLTRSKSQVHWNAMESRIWDSSIWVGDVKKAKKALGWKARTTLEQGLKLTMEWVKKQ